MAQSKLIIKDLPDAQAAKSVEQMLLGIRGVDSASVEADSGVLTVDFDPVKAGLDDILEAIHAAGYDATPDEQESPSDLFLPEAILDPNPSSIIAPVVESSGAQDLNREPENGDRPARAQRPRRAESDFNGLEPASVLSIDSPTMTDALGAALLAGLVFGLARLAPDASWSVWLQMGIAGIVQFVLGFHFYLSAGRLLRHGKVGMNTLVVLATSLAYGYSVYLALGGAKHLYFDTSAVIIAFVGIGRVLEETARISVARAVPDLLEFRPRDAYVIRKGQDQETVVPVEQLIRGDTVVVKPGQRVPVDGVVIEGTSTVDQSMLTGDAKPFAASPGGRVLTGTLNLTGRLKVRAERVGASTYLSQAVDLLQQAETERPRMQTLVERFATVLVFVVLGIAVVTGLVWGLTGSPDAVVVGDVEVISPWVRGMNAAIAVLIVACPCALGLAVPTSVMVGISLAARQGLLIKSAGEFEKAAKMTRIVLDQPGALSLRRPTVSNIISLDPAFSETDVLQLAANIEHLSDHPIGDAILAAARRMNLQFEGISSFKEVPGGGVSGHTRGMDVAVGSASMLRDMAVKGIGDATMEAMVLRRKGKSPVLVAAAGRVVGVIAMTDELKPDSALTAAWLRRLGVHPIVLTADTPEAGTRVVKKMGLGKNTDPAEHLLAEVDAHQKELKVEALRAAPAVVGFAGSGTADRDPLEAADVGIAVVSQADAGGDEDLQANAGGIVLVGNGLWSMVELVRLSRMTRYRVQMGLFWAVVFNVLLIPVAAVGWLHPMLAPIAMSLGTLCVMANALWLRRQYRPSRPELTQEEEQE